MATTDTPPPEAGMDWKRFAGPLSALAGLVGLLVAVGVITTIARSSDGGDTTGLAGNGGAGYVVEADATVPALNVNVDLYDDRIEPEIIFLPAGRPIRLVITNRTEHEHHFRIKGLEPTALRWMEVPEVDEYDAASMSPEELAAYGFAEAATITDEAELAHYFHHLTPQMVPSRPASPSGIKPLGTEVHGWVIRGTKDLIEFFALEPGEYVADNPRFPEITARVIVFDPSATG
jgi:hypothetical protein